MSPDEVFRSPAGQDGGVGGVAESERAGLAAQGAEFTAALDAVWVSLPLCVGKVVGPLPWPSYGWDGNSWDTICLWISSVFAIISPVGFVMETYLRFLTLRLSQPSVSGVVLSAVASIFLTFCV